MTIRAIRGATTLEVDEREHLHERTIELVRAMLDQNGLTPDDLVSMLFTATPDITSDFPAAAARALDLGDVPLICSVEMNVRGALGLVIRVMAYAEFEVPRGEVKHVYLHEAVSLRTDLAQ
ncbi:MAG: chorismate mutase [Demequinaceae bacterium]|nr:chorismate mutase [Demequinaceae bacterium]